MISANQPSGTAQRSGTAEPSGTAAVGAALESRLAANERHLRPADQVMASSQLGAARLTKFSFNRSMMRRAFAHGWTVTRSRFDVDAEGRGHADYRVDAEGRTFHFVAFTTTLDESQHTDRVVADAWEISGALVEPGTADGELDDDHFAELAIAVPLQEAARLDARVLVLTRGNRSVRFFDSLVESLAAGCQPDPDQVADAGYIMRSTAFYGNGKYGMKSFGGYDDDHPLRAPYRSQMLAAWLFRELSYDIVEQCARMRGGDVAVEFDDRWRHYFGLGNATGLGLVPYAFKHPKVLHTWAGVREVALAGVRRTNPAAGERAALLDRLRWWIDRAEVHLAPMGSDNRAPWLSPAELSRTVGRIRDVLADVGDSDLPLDALYRWAESDGVETCELVVSLLLELDDSIDDEALDRLLVADESTAVNSVLTVGELRDLIHVRYGWIDDLRLGKSASHHFWWVVSDNTEEPRRATRDLIDPEHREVAIDVARRVAALRESLDGLLGDPAGSEITVGRFLVEQPDHGLAVRRVVSSDQLYGEPRGNACDERFLPLDLQRFQLAMYGMDNFSPKSTDWLRVTLNQGAPRASDLNSGNNMNDDWVWPARPTAIENLEGSAS